MKKYVIRPGDTMNDISRRTGVKLSLLIAANPQLTDVNAIYPGQTIVIPELGKPVSMTEKSTMIHHPSGVYPKHSVSPATHQPITTASQKKTPIYFGFVWPHVVQADETWEVLSRKYHVSLPQLMHLNPKYVNGRQPKVGKIVYIPSSNKPSNLKKKPKPNRGETVKSEDNPRTEATVVPTKAQKVKQPALPVPPTIAVAPTEVPLSWDESYEESSSLLSSWDEWDVAAELKTVEVQQVQPSPGMPAPEMTGVVEWVEIGEEGWSQTVSLRNDNEHAPESK